MPVNIGNSQIRYKWLDTLRAIAVLLVLTDHLFFSLPNELGIEWAPVRVIEKAINL